MVSWFFRWENGRRGKCPLIIPSADISVTIFYQKIVTKLKCEFMTFRFLFMGFPVKCALKDTCAALCHPWIFNLRLQTLLRRRMAYPKRQRDFVVFECLQNLQMTPDNSITLFGHLWAQDPSPFCWVFASRWSPLQCCWPCLSIPCSWAWSSIWSESYLSEDMRPYFEAFYCPNKFWK